MTPSGWLSSAECLALEDPVVVRGTQALHLRYSVRH